METTSYIIENIEGWFNFIKQFPETATIALANGGQLESFPCYIRVLETVVVNENNEEVQAFILVPFYTEDALKLVNANLELRRINNITNIEGYNYAESEQEGSEANS